MHFRALQVHLNISDGHITANIIKRIYFYSSPIIVALNNS